MNSTTELGKGDYSSPRMSEGEERISKDYLLQDLKENFCMQYVHLFYKGRADMPEHSSSRKV